MAGPVASPAEFFAQLCWIDGTPLPAVIEPYRMKIFEAALGTFDPDGRPTYNLALTGRGKKNWKSFKAKTQKLEATCEAGSWGSLSNSCNTICNTIIIITTTNKNTLYFIYW